MTPEELSKLTAEQLWRLKEEIKEDAKRLNKQAVLVAQFLTFRLRKK